MAHSKTILYFTTCTLNCVPRLSPYELCDPVVGWRQLTLSYKAQHYFLPQQSKVFFFAVSILLAEKPVNFECIKNPPGRIFVPLRVVSLDPSCVAYTYACVMAPTTTRSLVGNVMRAMHATLTTNAPNCDRWRCCHVSNHVYQCAHVPRCHGDVNEKHLHVAVYLFLNFWKRLPTMNWTI